MRYMECGVEIQYRECQILRETAKEVLKEEGSLVQLKKEWIKRIAQVADTNELKASYAAPMTVFLGNLSNDLFEAISGYTEHLVRKGRGIVRCFLFPNKMIPYSSPFLIFSIFLLLLQKNDAIYFAIFIIF